MSVRISIIVEGDTEEAFFEPLREFLESRLRGRMPKLDPVPQDGRVPTGDKLRRMVEKLLQGKRPADAVIALTDVYTGTREFSDAADARAKMAKWVGKGLSFYPHAAQHDFEAWLIPYWETIQSLARSDRGRPAHNPERINHDKPPCHHIQEAFRTGSIGKRYVKARDGARILRGQDLTVAADACPELKSFLNTILSLCQAEPLA